MHDHFGDHRIIEGAYDITRTHRAIIAALITETDMIQATRYRQEPFGSILCINTRFNRVAIKTNVLLRQRKRFAGGNAQLPFHKVNTRDCLSNRMFDLKAGVHFHKPKPIVPKPLGSVDNKFDSACPFVSDGFCGAYSGSTHGASQSACHFRCGRLFDYFLISALQRTIPFKKMNRLLPITKDLNFNMTRRADIFFEQNVRISKGILCL